MRRYPASVAIVVTAFALVCQTAAPVDTMLAAVQSLLETLAPEQKKQAQLPFDSEERTNWHYIPRARQGVSLKTMTEPQRRAATHLLRTGLSQSGYTKAETIRALEDILLEMEKNPRRDREEYYFTIFGEPQAKGTWGWRYEGHHLSQNWTIVAGTAVATSPQFFGAHPAEVRQGKMAGARPLAAEEDLAFALLRSLDPEQRSQAVIGEQAPRDILTTNTREAASQEDRGLSYRDMSVDQRKQLMTLIEEHAGIQAQPLAQERLVRLRAAGLDAIRFAWMGALDRTEAGHYYRIQGPTFLIEFDNTQNRANHVHEVWRDFKGDFGRDLLAEHYRKAHR
ncbi:MAG TPA: DUF3500 domain-containing protein [Vicinamibacterales bacterium]|nr:DUF3500 domain-containing protein [Vicinamibacterales bacterium]